MNKEKKAAEQKKINELAKQYFYAKVGGNRAEAKTYMGQLYLIIVLDNRSIINKELNEKIQRFGLDYEIINDLFYDLLHSFNYDYNDNFCAYIHQFYKYKILDIVKKGYNSSGEKRDSTIYDEDGKEVFDDYASTESTPDDKFENKEISDNVRTTLLSLIMNCQAHNNGKRNNIIRLSYYRIFFTQDVMKIILDNNRIDFHNNAEVYESSDKEFVRYISKSGYNSLNDIIGIKFKHYSEVISDYDKDDKLIDIPCENIIIQKYRFQAGLDEKEVSGPNITQQRKKYYDEFKEIYSNISEG